MDKSGCYFRMPVQAHLTPLGSPHRVSVLDNGGTGYNDRSRRRNPDRCPCLNHESVGRWRLASGRDSPTLRRRRLGAELRRHREEAGLTIEVVASSLRCSPSKISRLETGRTGASAADVRAVLALCRVDAAEIEALVEIAEHTGQRPWWSSYGSVLTGAFVGLEAAAHDIRSFEAMCVPGLLQTERYARSVISVAWADATGAEVENRVQVRMARQALLREDEPVQFRAILDEAVLVRPVGGRDVMRGQLEHLASVAELPNVSIHVLPFSAGAHPGMEGSFVILTFPHPADLATVFVAMATGGVFQERPAEVDRYETIFERLRAASLPADESVSLVSQLAKER